ncbi:MAG: 3-deoxy-7-phosphoheptulonate synthase [Halobacteriovoraceae bacterium]|nr:3-deoxy-7-phosphoheptulonate synthase [Halobacteriovoraceae bacterium]
MKENFSKIIIAGPCSAESKDQMISTAKNIERIQEVSFFRAGLWKPRTRPNLFEGVGEKGLKWLQEIGQQTRLKTTTEVAKTIHVEKCLEYNIDALWIGARTTVSPFSVQEIAESLKGTKKTVLVKNPVNEDLSLWMGALERLDKAGIKKIIAIHRGFTAPPGGAYRNNPLWHIPLELKDRCPKLPIICDPSHMLGKREGLQKLSQESMDLGFDGLMIETHPCPQKALSDSKQQITPEDLKTLLHNLTYNSVPSRDQGILPQHDTSLKALRNLIEPLDQELLEILQKRMSVVKKIAHIKKASKLDVFQRQRMEELIKKLEVCAQKKGLDKKYIRNLYKIIHNESVNRQTEIINV